MAISKGGYALFLVFPPDFRVMEAGLVTGTNVSGILSSRTGGHSLTFAGRKGSLLLPDAATEYRSGCSCSSRGRVMLGSFSPEVSGKRACASGYAEKRAEYTDNWLNASVVYFSAG